MLRSTSPCLGCAFVSETAQIELRSGRVPVPGRGWTSTWPAEMVQRPWAQLSAAGTLMWLKGK